MDIEDAISTTITQSREKLQDMEKISSRSHALWEKTINVNNIEDPQK
jgi:hypothetical protein